MKTQPDAGDLADIQGLVYSGWGDHPFAGYLFATFDPARAKLSAWLSVIARSRSLDKVRARKRRGRVVDDVAQGTTDAADVSGQAAIMPDAAAEMADTRQHVMRCLAELPPDQRRAIEPFREEACIGIAFEPIRHMAVSVRYHAVGRHNGVTLDAEPSHPTYH